MSWGVLLATALLAPCAQFGNEPLIPLAERAGSVVIAECVEMTTLRDTSVRVELKPTIALKGPPPSPGLSATLAPSATMRRYAERQGSRPCQGYGMWFLQGVELLPVERGEYVAPSGAFVPVPRAWTPAAGDNLNQQILSAVTAAYIAFEPPGSSGDARLLAVLDDVSQEDAVGAARRLLAADSIEAQVMGLLAALNADAPEALKEYEARVGDTRDHPKFSRIATALGSFYVRRANGSIPELKALIETHASTPGVHIAVAWELGALQKREGLPLVIMLFDSPEVGPRIAAVQHLRHYTALAGPDGNINLTGNGKHPFWNEETRRYNDRSIPLEEQIAFWRGWWERNRAAFEIQDK
jgi:hypothetical protein